MSKFILADIIKKSKCYLYPPLISAATLDKVNKFSSLIPPISTIGFEWRLTEENTEVDYFIRATKRDGSDRIFAACNPEKSPASFLYDDPTWESVKQFCQIWLEPDSLLNQYVKSIWLEIDNQELNKIQPVPCLFFELSRQAIKETDWITEIALKTLYGKPILSKTKKTIQNCIAHLPEFAMIAYIGTMLSRPTSPIRLCVKIAIKDVTTYLQAIGWNHDLEKVNRTLDNLVKDFAENVVLTLDVGDTVMPRLGFEFKAAFRDKGWDVILERLVENELCYASDRDALLEWEGQPAELQNREFCRQLTVLPPDKLDDDDSLFVVRKLNHVKIDCYPNVQLKAKIYYCLIYFYHQKDRQ